MDKKEYLKMGEVILWLRDTIGMGSRSTLGRWIARGYFPEPSRIGPTLMVWKKKDLDKWMEENWLDGENI